MKSNHTDIRARNVIVAAGIDKHIASNVTLGGTSYTAAALKAVFTNETAALDASDALHKQWRDQVQVAHTAGKAAANVYALLRGYVVSQYGKDANAVLNDFGMHPPKVGGAKTVQTKAVANAKRTATRNARHTMGSLQKKAVKGDVTGIVVTPVTTAPATSPPVNPAPTPSPAQGGASPAAGTAPHS